MPPFKLIVAGSRTFRDKKFLFRVLRELINNELKDYQVEIVSGMAAGADTYGWQFGKLNDLTVHEFPISEEDWDKFKYAAGPIRNSRMAKIADGVLAFPEGKARGTNDMIKQMAKLNKQVWVYTRNLSDASS